MPTWIQLLASFSRCITRRVTRRGTGRITGRITGCVTGRITGRIARRITCRFITYRFITRRNTRRIVGERGWVRGPAWSLELIPRTSLLRSKGQANFFIQLSGRIYSLDVRI